MATKTAGKKTAGTGGKPPAKAGSKKKAATKPPAEVKTKTPAPPKAAAKKAAPAKPAPKKAAPAAKRKAAPRPPEDRYDTPEALAKFDAAHFMKEVELYDALEAAEAEESKAKKAHTDAKKMVEAARLAHKQHTATGKKWRGHKPPGVQPELPFVAPDPSNAEAAKEVVAATAAGTDVTADPDGPGWYPKDLWRSYPLDRWTHYGVLPSDLKKLAEGKHKRNTGATPITTVGELSDFTRPYASDPTRNNSYTDIKGIGPEGATRISDAELRFWGEVNNNRLMDAYAREKGFSPPSQIDGRKADAHDATQPAGGTGTPGDAGGDGDGKGQSGKVARRRKPHAANPGSKSARSRAAKGGKPPALKTSTPSINPSGVDPAEPFKDEHPATVPFAAGKGEPDHTPAEAAAAGG